VTIDTRERLGQVSRVLRNSISFLGLPIGGLAAKVVGVRVRILRVVHKVPIKLIKRGDAFQGAPVDFTVKGDIVIVAATDDLKISPFIFVCYAQTTFPLLSYRRTTGNIERHKPPPKVKLRP
jgi:hypothetical protein